MSEIAMNAAHMIDMLPDPDKNLAYELIKKLVLAWDPDFTKLTTEEAKQLVKSGMVEVNHVSTVSAHYEVFENDVFSIRGRGKYKLCGVGAKSRKGRTFVSYIEY